MPNPWLDTSFLVISKEGLDVSGLCVHVFFNSIIKWPSFHKYPEVLFWWIGKCNFLLHCLINFLIMYKSQFCPYEFDYQMYWILILCFLFLFIHSWCNNQIKWLVLFAFLIDYNVYTKKQKVVQRDIILNILKYILMKRYKKKQIMNKRHLLN